MKKYLIRLGYWLGLAPTTSRAYFVSNAGELIERRWLDARHSAPLERPVAHFSSTGQLLIHQ